MKNFREYISSGLVVAISKLPKNITNGDVVTFNLSKNHQLQSTTVPLVTPTLISSSKAIASSTLENKNYTFNARCLDWCQNKILSTKLGTNESVLLTPTLDGCSFAVFKDKKTKELISCHANFLVEDTEYAYFEDGFLDYEQYETHEDGSLKIYFQKVPKDEDPEDYEELTPEKNQIVYIKLKSGNYEQKKFIDTRTLKGTQNGLIDQNKINSELKKTFPSDRYETIFYITKSDYQQQLYETKGITSAFGIRSEKNEWQFYCFTTGPDKTCRIAQTDTTTSADTVTLRNATIQK